MEQTVLKKIAGFRCYFVPTESKATKIQIAFDAGTRAEKPEENGMAHFLEHVVFKGGEKFTTAKQVNDEAHRLGAMLNAYTSHDHVAFHITSQGTLAMEAFDLLSDFVMRPHLRQEDLDVERMVVIQEIQQYLDMPDEVAENLLDEQAYPNHPLGKTILGPVEHLERFDKADVVKFRDRTWNKRTAAVFFVGCIDHLDEDKIKDMLERFDSAEIGSEYPAAPRVSQGIKAKFEESNQAHLRLKYQMDIDVDSYAERAASNIFSTVLSTRLYEEIRENRGWCYSIGSYRACLKDAATLSVVGSLQPENCQETLDYVQAEIKKIQEQGITQTELEHAKARINMSIVLSYESTSGVLGSITNSVMFDKAVISEDELVAFVAAVDNEAIIKSAKAVAAKPAIGYVGPELDLQL